MLKLNVVTTYDILSRHFIPTCFTTSPLPEVNDNGNFKIALVLSRDIPHNGIINAEKMTIFYGEKAKVCSNLDMFGRNFEFRVCSSR